MFALRANGVNRHTKLPPLRGDRRPKVTTLIILFRCFSNDFEEQIGDDLLWLMLTFDRRRDDLVVSCSHALEFELAHCVQELGAFPVRPAPQPAAAS